MLEKIVAECIEIRHRIHKNPELSGEETMTRDLIVKELKAAGLEIKTYSDSTAVIGLWPGKDRSRSIALRADMDALPMQETSGLTWQSASSHAMHACGHDGHTSILIGVAKYLAEQGKAYAIDIKLLFQPAEESGNGAKRMVEANALNSPKVDVVFGLHGWPDLPLGTIGVHPHAVMASVDNFEITLTGRGGHGAQPHHALDPIVAAAQLIVAAQTLVSRGTDPLDSCVLTFGHLQAGTTFNVIPETSLLRGTVRTHSESVREKIKRDLEKLVQHVSEGLGLSSKLEWVEGCPPTINNSKMARLAKKAAIKTVGEEKCFTPNPSMAGEDFPFFLEQTPGAYLWLGLGSECGSLHHSRFDFNDAAIKTGIQFFLNLVAEYVDGDSIQ